MTLPPGQHEIAGFPRFGTHLHNPPPAVPAEPAIEIRGAGVETVTVGLRALAGLPRRELVADFHCVAGWSATGLRWEGVPLAALYAEVVAPLLDGQTITHLVFVGLDGYRSVATIEDALGEDVLIAERLDGRPLDGDHGAPLRLVSPAQYGFVSTKHLCRIELRSAAPTGNFGTASAISRVAFRSPLFQRHPRARVREEERHPSLPAWSLRPVYRALIPPIMALCARGGVRRTS